MSFNNAVTGKLKFNNQVSQSRAIPIKNEIISQNNKFFKDYIESSTSITRSVKNGLQNHEYALNIEAKNPIKEKSRNRLNFY